MLMLIVLLHISLERVKFNEAAGNARDTLESRGMCIYDNSAKLLDFVEYQLKICCCY